MRCSNKDVRAFVRACEKAGLYCEMTTNGHVQVRRDEFGPLLTTLSGTSGDHRGLKNARAQLRRQGVRL